MKHFQWRADIDGLRAVAVSLVVLFHAFPRQVGGGYIGVDIFFVISGFLISSIILKNLNENKFSFLNFYSRRVRRIFPALILVMGSCYVFGWHALLSDEYKELGKDIAGGAGFVANLVFWDSSGYFDRASVLKPLLHLWSLGIEEQFYLIWPLILWLVWKQKTKLVAVTLAIMLASFLFNIFMVDRDVVATFYSPLTRFWELLAGAMLAYYTLGKGSLVEAITFIRIEDGTASFIANVLSIAGTVFLFLGTLLLHRGDRFPGYWALMPVAGAVLLIAAGQRAWVNKYFLSHKFMVWIGLISYPLYLWHWPLLVFPRIIEGDEPNWPFRASAVMLAVLLAWLTYKFIEIPVRTSSNPWRYTTALSALMVMVGALGLTTFFDNGMPTRVLAKETASLSKAEQDHHGRTAPSLKNGALDLRGMQFKGKSKDAVLFMGDSLMSQYYARVAFLYSGIHERPYFSTTFAPRPGCRPVPKGEHINSVDRQCDKFYSAVIKLAQAPQYKRIVLSADWGLVFSKANYDATGKPLLQDLGRLKAMGKKIYIISMAPFSPVLAPARIAKKFRLAHLTDEGTTLRGDYWIRRDKVDFLQKPAGRLMQKMADSLGIKVINPLNTFCTAVKCLYVKDGNPLYVDAYHLRPSTTRNEATFIDRIVQNASPTPGPETAGSGR